MPHERHRHQRSQCHSREYSTHKYSTSGDDTPTNITRTRIHYSTKDLHTQIQHKTCEESALRSSQLLDKALPTVLEQWHPFGEIPEAFNEITLVTWNHMTSATISAYLRVHHMKSAKERENITKSNEFRPKKVGSGLRLTAWALSHSTDKTKSHDICTCMIHRKHHITSAHLPIRPS